MERVRIIVLAALAALMGAVPGQAAAQGYKLPSYRDAVPNRKQDTVCTDCGVIRSIRETTTRRDPKLHGTGSATAFDWRVIGAVVVFPFESDKQKPIVGGAGTPEMNDMLVTASYEITVRMDDGTFRTVERREAGRFGVGDRVRLTEGRLELVPDAR